MEGAKEIKCSEFGDAIINWMDKTPKVEGLKLKVVAKKVVKKAAPKKKGTAKKVVKKVAVKKKARK